MSKKLCVVEISASKEARERAGAVGANCEQHGIIPTACQGIGLDQANRTGRISDESFGARSR